MGWGKYFFKDPVDERLGFFVKIDKSDESGSKLSYDINIRNINFKELALLDYYLDIIKKAIDKKKKEIQDDEDIDFSKDVVLDQPPEPAPAPEEKEPDPDPETKPEEKEIENEENE